MECHIPKMDESRHGVAVDPMPISPGMGRLTIAPHKILARIRLENAGAQNMIPLLCLDGKMRKPIYALFMPYSDPFTSILSI